MKSFGKALMALLWGFTPWLAQARFVIPGFELVYNAPAETRLKARDLRDTGQVWRELIDGAKERLDIAQFYVANRPGSTLDTVIQRLRAAAQRGVRIRFLVESGVDFSYPQTLQELQSIPNLELRRIAYRELSGGILHAKYLLADGQAAYVGSANFDWRALSHIQETGLRIDDARVTGQLQAIFDQDWELQARLTGGQTIAPMPGAALPDTTKSSYLVASPKAFNPPGVPDSQSELARLLNGAQKHIRVQVMTYSPLSFGGKGRRRLYPVLDNALRGAAARGVQVQLMVADNNLKPPDGQWLKSLALVPHIQIRAVTIPQASTGPIPHARLIHSKLMTIDGDTAWVGTSNWAGGYLDNSRNLEVVMHNPAMAERLDRLFLDLWHSQYAAPVISNKCP